jgi:Ca2+-binding RTX toxin-like protein
MATVTNTSSHFGLNFTDPTLLAEVGAATVTSHSASQVVLSDSATGGEATILGSFTAFDAEGRPTAGTLTEIDAGGFTVSGFSVPVAELFAAPTVENTVILVSDVLKGNDLVTANNAPDVNNILTYDGNDTINAAAAPQADTLFGGNGDDSIVTGAAFNRVNGNQGEDTIVGHSVVGDWLLGGQGADTIDASHSTGANIINGNLGADTLVGGAGADSLRGGQGDDVIHAGSGSDWLSGDLGTNTLVGGAGMDTFHAAAGHDVVSGWHAGDVVQYSTVLNYQVAQVGADVHITFSNGGEMDLLNTQTTALTGSWITPV